MSTLVKQLEKDISELQDKISDYRAMIKLAEEDDQLKRIVHSCGKECFATPKVNQAVDHIDCIHSYGGHMIFPYVIKDGRKIYSYPVYFDIGHDPDYGYSGILPSNSWESEMRSCYRPGRKFSRYQSAGGLA